MQHLQIIYSILHCIANKIFKSKYTLENIEGQSKKDNPEKLAT